MGAGCRDRRSAEVPRRSVGVVADHPVGPRRRGGALARARIEAGIREAGDAVAADFVRSNYFDLGMILDYWGPRRLNHHTEATSMLYAARECARVLLLEGRDAVIERHRLHGAAMLAGVEALGLAVFGDVAHKMNNVVAVEIPDGVPGDVARAAMLEDFGIEIGTSFGPLHGRVWRIGTMGYNARKDAVLHDARRARGRARDGSARRCRPAAGRGRAGRLSRSGVTMRPCSRSTATASPRRPRAA